MEFMEGKSLRELLREKTFDDEEIIIILKVIINFILVIIKLYKLNSQRRVCI